MASGYGEACRRDGSLGVLHFPHRLIDALGINSAVQPIGALNPSIQGANPWVTNYLTDTGVVSAQIDDPAQI